MPLETDRFWWEWQGRDLIDAGWIVDPRHWCRGYATEALRWDRMLLGRLGAPTPALPRARRGGPG